MKIKEKITRFLFALIIFLWGVFIGLRTTPQRIYYNSNLEVATDAIGTLNRCMEGWRSTLDTLNDANELLNNLSI